MICIVRDASGNLTPIPSLRYAARDESLVGYYTPTEAEDMLDAHDAERAERRQFVANLPR